MSLRRLSSSAMLAASLAVVALPAFAQTPTSNQRVDPTAQTGTSTAAPSSPTGAGVASTSQTAGGSNTGLGTPAPATHRMTRAERRRAARMHASATPTASTTPLRTSATPMRAPGARMNPPASSPGGSPGTPGGTNTESGNASK